MHKIMFWNNQTYAIKQHSVVYLMPSAQYSWVCGWFKIPVGEVNFPACPQFPGKVDFNTFTSVHSSAREELFITGNNSGARASQLITAILLFSSSSDRWRKRMLAKILPRAHGCVWLTRSCAGSAFAVSHDKHQRQLICVGEKFWAFWRKVWQTHTSAGRRPAMCDCVPPAHLARLIANNT